MPIAKGQPWGTAGPLPEGARVVKSDAEARQIVEEARRHKVPIPPLALLGGDLCRTLGGSGDRRRLETGEGMSFPLDLGEVLLDGRLHLFVAHLVARSPLWGRSLVAMNAQWLGRWNLGPRAHPDDGLLDIYQARLSLPERLKVRARLHHGVHLPHPDIDGRRVAAAQFDLERATPVRLDGDIVGEARTLSIRCRPDALVVWV